MPEFPDTRTSLLARIQATNDEDAWHQFVTIYRPVVYRLARQRGLQDADAEDLAQRVLIAVQRAIGSWEADPTKGRFRFWLARIAQNAIINALTRRPPDLAAGSTTIHNLLEEHPEPDPETQESLQREYRRSLFRWAAERILPEFRDGTWEAFWLTTVDGMRVEETAHLLGKSLGAVYAARSRVMRRLKDEIQQGNIGWKGSGANGEK
jgi:RNA polymerase sigma factor (sigma-70 family)